MSVKQMREAAGLTRVTVSKYLDLSASQYGRLEDENNFKVGHIERLKALLGCSADDLIGQDITLSPLAGVGRAFRVHIIRGGELIETQEVAVMATASIAVSGGAMVVRIPDNAMDAAFINAGDLVLFEPGAVPTPGKIVAAEAPTGEVVVRFYVPLHPTDPRAPGWILRAANAAHGEIISTDKRKGSILGVAVMHQRML